MDVVRGEEVPARAEQATAAGREEEFLVTGTAVEPFPFHAEQAADVGLEVPAHAEVEVHDTAEEVATVPAESGEQDETVEVDDDTAFEDTVHATEEQEVDMTNEEWWAMERRRLQAGGGKELLRNQGGGHRQK